MNLADALIPRSYKDGECIIKQGEAADGMYFIEDGTVRICILDEANKEVEVRRMVIVGAGQNTSYFSSRSLFSISNIEAH